MDGAAAVWRCVTGESHNGQEALRGTDREHPRGGEDRPWGGAARPGSLVLGGAGATAAGAVQAFPGPARAPEVGDVPGRVRPRDADSQGHAPELGARSATPGGSCDRPHQGNEQEARGRGTSPSLLNLPMGEARSPRVAPLNEPAVRPGGFVCATSGMPSSALSRRRGRGGSPRGRTGSKLPVAHERNGPSFKPRQGGCYYWAGRRWYGAKGHAHCWTSQQRHRASTGGGRSRRRR